MEGKCRKCERVTKYKFSACFAEKFREDHDNYSEEEKLIGKCKNCDGNLVVVKATTNARRIFWQKKQTDEHSNRNLLTLTEWLQWTQSKKAGRMLR